MFIIFNCRLETLLFGVIAARCCPVLYFCTALSNWWRRVLNLVVFRLFACADMLYHTELSGPLWATLVVSRSSWKSHLMSALLGEEWKTSTWNPIWAVGLRGLSDGFILEWSFFYFVFVFVILWCCVVQQWDRTRSVCRHLSHSKLRNASLILIGLVGVDKFGWSLCLSVP